MSTPRSISYDYASNPDEVFSLLKDPEFLRRRCEAAGESNVDIQIHEKDLAARNFDAITLNWVDFD